MKPVTARFVFIVWAILVLVAITCVYFIEKT